MKPHRYLAPLLSFLVSAHAVMAQGPLIPPPGPPMPTMKSLSQIEPRTDLSTVPGTTAAMHRITQSGSYYLSGNLDVTKNTGIEIVAEGVTLDLRGFTVFRSSTAAATGTAIRIPGSNTLVKNGHIVGSVTHSSTSPANQQFSGPGFVDGISNGLFGKNIQVIDVSVSGCLNDGISLGLGREGSVFRSQVSTVGGIGVRADRVTQTTASVCGGTAIRCDIADRCLGSSVGNAINEDGISARTVNHSKGVSKSGSGIFALRNVLNSSGTSDNWTGIRSEGNVSNSWAESTGTTLVANGIQADGNVTNSMGIAAIAGGIKAEGSIYNSTGKSSGGGSGIEARTTVSNSNGSSDSGNGIRGTSVQNSFGETLSGASGIFAFGTVSNSRGKHEGDGEAIRARIVSASTAVQGSIVATVAKVDGTP